jgi:hypothetical protein
MNPIKAGRAIDSATMMRRREQRMFIEVKARKRREREADPTRKLTPLEERSLRRFGYEPYPPEEEAAE